MLKQVYEEVQNSAGSAEQELNSYLESITGKLQKLQNSWQELWYNFIDSDAIKGVVDVLTSLANILEKITTFAKPLGTVSALAGGILSVLGRGKPLNFTMPLFAKPHNNAMWSTQRVSFLCREKNERPLELIHKLSNIGGSPKPEMVSEQ